MGEVCGTNRIITVLGNRGTVVLPLLDEPLGTPDECELCRHLDDQPRRTVRHPVSRLCRLIAKGRSGPDSAVEAIPKGSPVYSRSSKMVLCHDMDRLRRIGRTKSCRVLTGAENMLRTGLDHGVDRMTMLSRNVGSDVAGRDEKHLVSSLERLAQCRGAVIVALSYSDAPISDSVGWMLPATMPDHYRQLTKLSAWEPAYDTRDC